IQTMAVLFFFSSRRRHTRFDCDWSSDVCSSDLAAIEGSGGVEGEEARGAGARYHLAELQGDRLVLGDRLAEGAAHLRVVGREPRSEERRVGKEWRSRWSPDH